MSWEGAALSAGDVLGFSCSLHYLLGPFSLPVVRVLELAVFCLSVSLYLYMEKEIKGGGKSKISLQHKKYGSKEVIWSRRLGPGVMLIIIPSSGHHAIILPTSLGGRSVSHKGNLILS